MGMTVKIVHDQFQQQNGAGQEERTHDSLIASQTHIPQS